MQKKTRDETNTFLRSGPSCPLVKLQELDELCVGTLRVSHLCLGGHTPHLCDDTISTHPGLELSATLTPPTPNTHFLSSFRAWMERMEVTADLNRYDDPSGCSAVLKFGHVG